MSVTDSIDEFPSALLGELGTLPELGRNALVTVYRAQWQGQKFRVEVLNEHDGKSQREFHRTTALQARLGHPGIPGIKFSGWTKGRLFRVKEVLEGQAVSSLFASGGMPVKSLVGTARALSSTLTSLHTRGMVHAEINPQDLKVDASGLVRFADIGRALVVGRSLPANEKSSALAYLAPECKEGAPARLESDIYSLGMVLLCLAAGRPAPAKGLDKEFLKEGTAKLSPAFRVLLRAMLDKEPNKRPGAKTVTDCLSRLEQLDVLLRLRRWTPESSASSFLGFHAYPVLGREKELAQLMALWQRASRGEGTSVTLLGVKGSGRGRLVEELRRGVQRDDGKMVRHSLEAQSSEATLIVNLSHKGRHGSQSSEPWLSVNFAEEGPVPDEHIIELGPLAEGDCLRLAESYLAASLTPDMQQRIFALGPQLPAELLLQLEQWCEEGSLRPSEGGWIFREASIPDKATPTSKKRALKTGKLKIRHEEALKTIVELWSTSLLQDDPLVSALMSFCKALKCERADLYQIIDGRAKYVCASSFGRHRLNKELVEQIMSRVEPVHQAESLLYPLRCGSTFCGFLSLTWWEAAVPEVSPQLLSLIGTAASPIALTLGQTQLEDRRLTRISLALEEILQATSEASDILTRLAGSLRKCLEFDLLSAWISTDNGLEKLFTNPQGESEHDGSGHEQALFAEPNETRLLETDEDVFLALPLVHAGEFLAGVVITRDPSIGFSETECSWAGAIARVAESALKNARL